MSCLAYNLLPRFALTVGMFCLSGCGLAEYEKKAQDQQKQVEKLERADKLLGEPIELPRPEKNAPEPMVFMRLPKELSSHAEKRPFAGLTYYAFPRLNASSPIAEVLLAYLQPALMADPTSQGKPENVIQKVKDRYGLGSQKGTPRTVPGFLRPGSTVYESFQLERGNYAVLVFLSEKEGLVKSQVGVVFNVEKAKKDDPAVQEMIEYSLETLAVGFEATSALDDYKRIKGATSKTPPASKPGT